MLPPDSPAEYSNRETLWNDVELSERRRDSRVAREVEVALSKEIPATEQLPMLHEYIKANFVDQGMIADFGVHDKRGNPHAHILLTTREVTSNGFGKKVRDWDKKSLLCQWRENWEKTLNCELERNKITERVSHESLFVQGIYRIPEKHRGRSITALRSRGIKTEYDKRIEKEGIEQERNRQQKREQTRSR